MIEERAKSCATECIEWMYQDHHEDENGVTSAILRALKQQRNIDIDKACDALYRIQEELNADLINIEKAIEIITKAMKE